MAYAVGPSATTSSIVFGELSFISFFLSASIVVRVDRSMSEHLRRQMRANPCTMFLWFWSPKNILNFHPVFLMSQKSFNLLKKSARYGVFGVKGSMFNDGWFKHIKISSLRSLHRCLWNTKKFYKALVSAPIKFSIPQNGLKMKKIWGWN